VEIDNLMDVATLKPASIFDLLSDTKICSHHAKCNEEFRKYGYPPAPMKVGRKVKLYYNFPYRFDEFVTVNKRFACRCEITRITEKAVQIARLDNQLQPVWFPQRGIQFHTRRNHLGVSTFTADIQGWFERKMDDRAKEILGVR
jgi:hypothetical protein